MLPLQPVYKHIVECYHKRNLIDKISKAMDMMKEQEIRQFQQGCEHDDDSVAAVKLRKLENHVLTTMVFISQTNDIRFLRYHLLEWLVMHYVSSASTTDH